MASGCGGGRCSCLLTEGTLIGITGDGEPGSPYVVTNLTVAGCSPIIPGSPPISRPTITSQEVRDGLVHLEVDVTTSFQDVNMLLIYADVDVPPNAVAGDRVHLLLVDEIHRAGTEPVTATLDMEVYRDIAGVAQPSFQVRASYVNCQGFEGPLSPVTPVLDLDLGQGRRRREETQGDTRNMIVDGGVESYLDGSGFGWLEAAGHDVVGPAAWTVDAAAARSGQRGVRYDPTTPGSTQFYWNAAPDEIAGQAMPLAHEGQDFQHLVWARPAVGTHNGFDVVVEYIDSAGLVIATDVTTVAPSTLAAGVWAPIEVISHAPVGVLKVAMSIAVNDTGVAGVIDFDDGYGWTMDGGDVVDDAYLQSTFGATPLPGAPVTVTSTLLAVDYIGQPTVVKATSGVGINLPGGASALGYCVVGGIGTIGQRITNPQGAGGISGGGGAHGHGVGGSPGGAGGHNHFNSGVTTAAGGGASQGGGAHTHGGGGFHTHTFTNPPGPIPFHNHSGNSGTHPGVGNHQHSHGSHTHIWLGINGVAGGHGHGSGSLNLSGVGNHSHAIPAGSSAFAMIAWDHQVRRFTPAGNTILIEAQGQQVVGAPTYVSGTVMAVAKRLRFEER
jgi:hypothetical protein